LNATTVKSKALRKVFAQQKQHIATLDALDIEQCYIVAEMLHEANGCGSRKNLKN